ncbi:PadR family transcriptional regulator [Salipaludibacillus sp. HK11]|uniref:PadR family transcriptional regulator n=1 Tax=Salipaludibacillus sp. HK11 TaxID=3394320 RepID=UPI0039FBAC07
MNDPFTNLKNAMKKTVFKDLSFSDERKNAVKETIRGNQSQPHLHFWKEETLLALFETLQDEAKHGFEISSDLFQNNVLSFQNNEGQLYTLLHLLENKEILTSKWIGDKKYYSLTVIGKKYLEASKQGSDMQRTSLKQLLVEVSL